MIYDAVIAGAGPVGLFLACELRLAGVSVLVLEQAEDPRSPLKRLPLGLRGLSAPALEALHRRGLLADVGRARVDASDLPQFMRPPRRPGGHFAGITFALDDVDAARWRHRLPSPAGERLPVELERLESVLADHAAAQGVEIRRGVGVEGFDQTEEIVTIRAGGETFRGLWLVGCDGGRSAVRKAGGFAFAGTEPEFTGYSAVAEVADPESLKPGRHYTPTGMYAFSPPGTITMLDFDGGAFHRAQPITLEHLQAALRRVSGAEVTLTSLRLATTWTDRAFQAADYRDGRALLAGDAAHLHSPLGGQGLNLGLGDAMNLGWKLAATIRGDAPEGLLDSYTRERRPIGAQVLDWSRAQVAIMRPNQSSRALAAIFRDLMETRDGATYFAQRVWGAGLRYDLGGGHDLIGRSAPDFELQDGTRLGERLRSGKGLLLDFDAQPSRQGFASHLRDRVSYVACDAKERLGVSALLVRPDGVVAWATESAADLDGASGAASRWFGGAAPAGRSRSL